MSADQWIAVSAVAIPTAIVAGIGFWRLARWAARIDARLTQELDNGVPPDHEDYSSLRDVVDGMDRDQKAHIKDAGEWRREYVETKHAHDAWVVSHERLHEE